MFSWLIKKIGWLFIPVIGPVIWVFDNFPTIYKDLSECFFLLLNGNLTDFYIWFFGKITEMLTSFFADNDFVVGVVEMSK